MCIVGKDQQELDTPALWVDLDRMETNIRSLAAYFASAGIAWRPHTKGIKVPEIACRLLAAGAIGITCAKLSEAEVMASAGIHDILVANQVVGARKVARLVELRRSTDIMVAIDSAGNAAEVDRAARETGVRIRILVEVNTGMDRAGVAPGERAVRFCEAVAEYRGLEFAGLMGWEGHAFRARNAAEREWIIKEAVGRLVETAFLCRRAGLTVDIVSCGGSVSYQTASHVAGITESQTGGAVFTDVAYRERGVPLEPSLHIAATVTSRPTRTRVIVDAGRKSMDGSVAMPVAVGLPGARLTRLSAEHGVLELETPSAAPAVGERVDFVAGYGDNTIYQHDILHGVRESRVEVVWPILGRGKLT